MRLDHNKAIKLRKEGKSYKEITDILGVPKSTLSNWLSPHKWSRNIEQSLREQSVKKSRVRIKKLNKIRGQALKELYLQAEKEAEEEFADLKYHPLFTSVMMLYWGEGDRKTRHAVRIGNTDPRMLRLFVLFLRDICSVPEKKIKAHVLIYKDLDREEMKQFWSKTLRIPLERFTKCTILPSRHKKKKSPYGVGVVVCTSTYLKVKIKKWLELMPQALLDEEYYKYTRV